MSIVVGLSGRKQSGKNTVCEYLMKKIDEKFADQLLAFDTRLYSFADPLKQFCIDVMGLSEKQCYGTDEDKNSETHYVWDTLPHDIQKVYAVDGKMPVGHMTGREIMQVFGTDIMRDMFDKNIWVNGTFNLINSHGRFASFIADTRFPSEVDAIRDHESGYLIRLTRKVAEDIHVSETALDDYDFQMNLGDRVCIIENQDMTIDEQNEIAWNFIEKIL